MHILFYIVVFVWNKSGNKKKSIKFEKKYCCVEIKKEVNLYYHGKSVQFRFE